jgi:GNAT superfamily N-acetyltransferase
MEPGVTPPPLTLASETSPDQTTIRAIASGLDAYNARFAPAAGWSPHWITGRDPSGVVQAGVQFIIALDWLFVHWLWVAEPYRKLGIGSRLLSSAETAAREKRRRAAYLDTFTFQAPKFYQRHGYREFGRLSDFPRGQARIWMSKAL